MIKFTYNGRSFTSTNSLSNAIKQDINRKIEQNVRRAAGSTGASVRKTHKGFEIEGNAQQIERFHNRFGK